jgi:hydroxyacylglutathione hydrolase
VAEKRGLASASPQNDHELDIAFHRRDGRRHMELDVFTGGIFDTNSYFLLKAGILIDAPQDTAEWLHSQGYTVKTLLLTHGHIDHVWDAARIQREHGCKIGYHPDTTPLVTEPDFFKKFGFNWEIEPIQADFFTEETVSQVINGVDFQIFHVPGHCPGSVAFLEKSSGYLFGGDVLFAGGIGRTDLPGGDHDLLIQGIREKLWPLSDDTTVLPGHGPATKIGVEKQGNPYIPR